MTRTVWVVKAGPITQAQIDDDIYPQDALGLPEWQFSDGPSGQRTRSDDYDDLELGLQDHSGCIIIYEGEDA